MTWFRTVNGFSYEVVNQRWHGNSSRGRRALASAGPLCKPEDFIAHLRTVHPSVVGNLDCITFQRWSEASHQMCFAICYTLPDYPTRTLLYDAAATITAAMGWYPLVTGQRLRPRASRLQSRPETLASADVFTETRYGELVRLRPAAAGVGGCAFVLEMTSGSVLLDCGFAGISAIAHRPRFAVVTHSHADHAGGLRSVANMGVPAVLSESCYWQLWSRGGLQDLPRRCIFSMRPPANLKAEDGTAFTFLPSAHSPGSMMVKVTSRTGDELLYPGDDCRANSYYRQASDDLLGVFSPSASRRYLLVDGSFLGHEPPRSALPDLAGVEPLVRAAMDEGGPLVFAAATPEYLYSLYLWVYKLGYLGRTNAMDRFLVADRALISLLQSTFGGYMFGGPDGFDPYLNAMVGKGHSNYLETVRLYRLSNGKLPDLPGPTDIFCTLRNLPGVMGAMAPDAPLFVVGRLVSLRQACVTPPLGNW